MKEKAKSNFAAQQRGIDIPSKRTYHFEEYSTQQSSCITQGNVYDNKRKNAWRGRGSKLERQPDGRAGHRNKIYSLLQEGFTKIVVDMKGVRWISSTGLGTLIAALTSVRNKSGDLRLANITEKVESLFAITQLVKVFKTYETVDRAIASYK
jgi:anti-sigma B factor antagonist